MGTAAVIHCQPSVAWQGPFAAKLAAGLKRVGIPSRIVSERNRVEGGFPILLGTTFWRAVEASGDFLLVDRCSFGDTNSWVSLVWNGHGRRGDHRLPERVTADRWERYAVPVAPWQTGRRIVLCGQTDSYCERDLDSWYRSVAATHFRRHPAGANPTGLPAAVDWSDARVAVTLNSSVAVQALLAGVPTVTQDEGSMAWDVTGHSLDDVRMSDRLPWLHRLAWTQWTHDEIAEGTPWAYHL